MKGSEDHQRALYLFDQGVIQHKKIERLEKAIEIMDSALKKIEILTTYGDSVYAAAGLPVPHAEIAKEALAKAREVMG